MQDRIEQVQAELEQLSVEVTKLVETVRGEAAEAYKRGDVVAFERLDRQQEDMAGFAAQIEAMAKQWRALTRQGSASAPISAFPPPAFEERVLDQVRIAANAPAPRPARGERTHEKEFIMPILQVLHEAGGSARRADAIRRLNEIMGPRLTEFDKERYDKGEIRWVGTANVAHFKMVAVGLLSAHSPRGVWEITPAGEALLRSGDLESIWPALQKARPTGRQ